MAHRYKVSARERQVLAVLAAEYNDGEPACYYMRGIARITGLEVSQVRRSVRALARKGLAEYVRGLFDEDGMVAGSGYCCTKTGFDFIEITQPKDDNNLALPLEQTH